MKNDLSSSMWKNAKEGIRTCHLSLLQENAAKVEDWKVAFDALVNAIRDERKTNADFAKELSDLTEESGFDYSFEDILEEYFDFLESKKEGELIVESCDTLLELFAWKKDRPSQYMFRKGDALDKMGREKEALELGEIWLADYPDDFYAAASNVFLLISMGKKEEAMEITERYLRKEWICDSATDTFYMAANRLYEITDDPFAKERVAKKMAEYDAIKGMIED